MRSILLYLCSSAPCNHQLSHSWGMSCSVKGFEWRCMKTCAKLIVKACVNQEPLCSFNRSVRSVPPVWELTSSSWLPVICHWHEWTVKTYYPALGLKMGLAYAFMENSSAANKKWFWKIYHLRSLHLRKGWLLWKGNISKSDTTLTVAVSTWMEDLCLNL